MGSKFSKILGEKEIHHSEVGLLAKPANEPRSYGCWVACSPEPAPQTNDEAVDFVFVHGITGTQTGTWITKNKEGKDVLWPRDLLPPKIPNCRVIFFGYDADVANFWAEASQNRLGDHANSLVGDLGQVRRETNTTTRPIIFVAHSMGGLLVQKALDLSQDSPSPHLSGISTSTFAIAFLGTPHLGSHLASWASVGSKFLAPVKRTNNPLLTVLGERSETLDNIQRDFEKLIHNRVREDFRKQRELPYQIHICCFFEELALKGVGKVVEKESARIYGWPCYSIHANHMNLSKFTDEGDPNFTRVYGTLLGWVEDLKKLRADDGNVAGPAGQASSPAVTKTMNTFGGRGRKGRRELKEVEAQIKEVREDLRGGGGGKKELRRELEKLNMRKEKLEAKL